MSMILRCILLTSVFLLSHSVKAEEYQPLLPASLESGLPADFAKSVFCPNVSTFLKNVFNSPAYAPHYLSNNWAHFVELVDFGNRTNKDKIYMKSVIRLFCNKIKASSYVNAYAFLDLLNQLPTLMEHHFTINTQRQMLSLKDIIFEMQYQAFKNQFPEFKSNPELFLNNLAQEIEDAADLRKLMNCFLEVCLNKLVWSPEDQFETWHNVKAIADSMTMLCKKTIISDLDDLNSLCMTLIERYCLFLDIASSHIEVQTYQHIREDMANCQSALVSLDEQEDLLEKKSSRLARCLMDLEAKARARTSGIVI